MGVLRRTSRDIRSDSRLDVLHAVLSAGETTRNELAQLTGLQGSWSGQASSAFQAAVHDWRATQQHVEQSLAGLNQALGAAALHYGDVEAANARLFVR